MLIKDFKNRLYRIMEVGLATTLLESVDDGSRVRIKSHGWVDIGFLPAPIAEPLVREIAHVTAAGVKRFKFAEGVGGQIKRSLVNQ